MAAGAAPLPHKLLCIGNPLVELHAEVPVSVLDRFELPSNARVQVEERHFPLRDLLLGGGCDLQCAPGGGAASAAMAVQGLLRTGDGRGGDPVVSGALGSPTAGAGHAAAAAAAAALAASRVAVLGGVGRDELGTRLKEMLRQEGVQPLLSDSESEATGWRAVLRTGRGNRTSGNSPGEDRGSKEELGPAGIGTLACATYSGAAKDYKLDHLRFKVWDSVETAKVVYVESLFLTVSAESAKSVAEYCAEMGNTFCLNLSAPYLCRYFYDRILTLLPYTDYVIGNEAEYLALAEHRKDETGGDIDAVATWLGKLPRADGDPGKRRHVIATCGQRPCIVAATWRGYGVKVQRFPVPPVKASRYVGKDGAGDAFAGGILYGLMHGADVDGCVQMALHAANAAVQRIGPRFVFKDKPHLQLPTPHAS